MIKKERGAITLFTLVICMFLLVNVLLISVGVMNKNSSQEKETAKINENYEVSQAKMEQVYQKALESNEYPTYGQLLKLLEQAKEEAKQEAKKEVENTMNEEKLKMYPIGSIYISTKETDPSKFIGGTWERYGKGQTLVGLDENQAEFDTVDETGGQKNITLSEAQLPSHSHSIPALSGSTSEVGNHSHFYLQSKASTEEIALDIQQIPSHLHTVTLKNVLSIKSTFTGQSSTTSSNGSHSHDFNAGGLAMVVYSNSNLDAYGNQGFTSSNGSWWWAANKNLAGILSSGAHTHTVTAAGTITNEITPDELRTTATGGLNGATKGHAHAITLSKVGTEEAGAHKHDITTNTSATGATGSGQTVNVQDPYITVYMWRRIS